MEYYKNIALANRNFMKHEECDIILGSGCFLTIFRYGRNVSIEIKLIAKTPCFDW